VSAREPRPDGGLAASLPALRRRLADGEATLGYLVTTPSVQIVQALARTGVDWLMIDTEHAPVGIESVAAMVAATGGTPATPIVRVPAARPELVKPVLDCGALGVVFPQIATRQEAEATVQAVRYAPKGQRGYGPTYAALRWGCRISNT
jgi:4-hydroxy-2-oxoheptanedioate aldolase